jgi:uncharacterized protein (TIGR03435 family)
MTTALKKLAALAWLCGTLSILALGACVCRVASAQNGGVGNEAMKRMPPDADPSFEVATIKPSDPNSRDAGFQLHGRNFVIKNQTVGHMLTFAYGIHPEQLIGEPTWFTTGRYDIVGVPDVEGEPNLKQWQGIVRKVLADRFGLKFHTEKRELTVYAITVAKGGSKMRKSQGDPNTLGDEGDNDRGGQTTMKITNMSMTAFALVMQFFMDKPVVDQTGLAGRWDFQWTWTTDESRASPDANAAPGMFTAIQEQLGLKLDATKAQADAFVVDHVERPGPN